MARRWLADITTGLKDNLVNQMVKELSYSHKVNEFRALKFRCVGLIN